MVDLSFNLLNSRISNGIIILTSTRPKHFGSKDNSLLKALLTLATGIPPISMLHLDNITYKLPPINNLLNKPNPINNLILQLSLP